MEDEINKYSEEELNKQLIEYGDKLCLDIPAPTKKDVEFFIRLNREKRFREPLDSYDINKLNRKAEFKKSLLQLVSDVFDNDILKKQYDMIFSFVSEVSEKNPVSKDDWITDICDSWESN